MPTRPTPPETMSEIVVDEMHGHRIEDPYRWLEDGDSDATRRWTEAQNAYTGAILGEISGRDALRARLASLLSIGAIGTPRQRGGRYFYTRRDGEQNQPVLVVRDTVDGQDRILFDPNAVRSDGTAALDWWYPSLDGRLLAYGVSESGDEWSTLRIRDVQSGEDLADRIPRTRYASVAWLPDNSGFYYTRFPSRGDVPAGDEHYNESIFFHLLGRDPAGDETVLPRAIGKEELPSVAISRDGRFLLAMINPDFYRTDVYLRDLNRPGAPWITIAEGYGAQFSAMFAGETLLLHTNLDAPNWMLYAVDPASVEKDQWRIVVPETADAVLESVTPSNGGLLVQHMRNAVSELTVYTLEGEYVEALSLPELGTVTAVTGGWSDREAFFSFESFVVPTTVFALDGEWRMRQWATVEAPVNAKEYTVKQEWYLSRDGTRVSTFIVHHRDLDVSRTQPAVLTGYGGFNIARTPGFLRDAYLWLERGGIYALPNLRGGSEYGEAWHRAGMLERKQNVFDDFITAAEHLIARGYTEPAKLAIYGRSNGGLLVGAAMVQRPDLFKAVVCGVPLLDMLRYHRFLIARWWIPEYGSAEDASQFEFLRAYSPYHNVRPGEQYPAVLFVTAESDSRVEPLHARKMAALMQALNESDLPILIRVEARAGHGVGKPLAKSIEDQTDMWSFLTGQLELTQP